ncbi:hypothetical protein D3C77_330380 [compost metagenome]
MNRAHVAVNEVFQLHAGRLPQIPRRHQIHLPGRNDPGDAHLFQRLNHLTVMNVHHDRGMHGKLQAHFLNKRQNSEILHDNGIRSRLLQKTQIFTRLFNFPFV